MKFKIFRCQPVWGKARQICVRDDNEEFGTFNPKDDLSWLDEYPVIDEWSAKSPKTPFLPKTDGYFKGLVVSD